MQFEKIVKIKGLPLFVAGVIVFSCQSGHSGHVPENAYRVRTFKTETGWGYQVENKEKVFIYQPTIPAIGGNRAFKTAEDAFKTGNLVLKKLKNRRNPGITVEELDSLQVVYTGRNRAD